MLSSTQPVPLADADAAPEQLSENASNGAAVGITAQTTDAEDGAALTYSLDDTAGGRFAIDAASGVVTVANAALIDFETATSHAITVRATDSTGQYVTQGYTIQITDGNDAPTVPVDANAATNTVAENAATGTLVGITASATDPNAGDAVSYSLSNDAGGRFAIDAATGVVTVANGGLLDFETATSHTITVQASDGTLVRQQNFTIAVTNVQDNPIWTGTAGNDTFTASNTDSWTLLGLEGDDKLTGGTGSDTLVGGAGNDTLSGGAGSNTYLFSGTGDGFDAIVGGAGADVVAASSDGTVIGLQSLGGVEAITANGRVGVTISGDANANTLNLTAVTLTGISRISGGGGNDTITTGAGADTLSGDAGNDALNGGDGNDIFLVTGTGDGFDAVTGGVGTDVIRATTDGTTIGLTALATVEAITADGRAGVTISGDAAANTLNFSLVTLTGIGEIDGGAGNDTITGSGGNDALAGNAGDDTLDAGAGDDTFLFAGSGEGFDLLTGGLGNDTIKALADGTVIGLRGMASVEALTADGHADVSILGSSAADSLDFSAVALTGIAGIGGGVGNDTLKGSAGDDVFTFSGAGQGFDAITGNAGNDSIRALTDGTIIGLTSLATVEAISADGHVGVTIAGSTGNEVLDLTAVTLTGIEAIDGGAGNDSILGGAGADTLIGNAGNDTLSGGAGDDSFQFSGTGGGFDLIAGGSGSDRIVATSAGTTIGLSGLSGVETVTSNGLAGVAIQGSGNADILDFSAVTLTGLVGIDGGAGNDTITGSGDDDVITGNAGDDSLLGGGGNDTFRVSGAAQGVDAVDGGTGTDRILAMAGGTVIGLSSLANIEAIDANGFAGVTVQGSALANTLDFSAVTLTGIARIDGLAGNDVITGSSGDDVIAGGAGADTIVGGAGNDTVSYWNASARVVVSLSSSIVGSGDALGDQISGVENIIGSDWDDSLAGDGNNNLLAGGAGNDTLTAGIGADTLDGGAGTDTVQWRSGTDAVQVNLATGSLGGGAAAYTFISIESVAGTTFNDVLIGSALSNTLMGGAGDDTLDGGAGADTLIGEAGNDSYFVDAAADVVTEAAGGGTDQVTTSLLSYTLGANVENLIFSGTGAFTGTGNALANAITGGAGADTLNGGAGQDILTGGLGADVFRFSALADTAVGSADRVTDFSQAQGDRLDISLFDANTAVAGDQAFAFIGTAAFTAGTRGQVRYEQQTDGNTHVFGDVDGDATANFEIVLAGAVPLTASNFIL